MLATKLDDKRRMTLPARWRPKTAVTIQEVDEDCLLVRRVKEDATIKVVAIQDLEHLPEDPEWDARAARLARAASQNLPEPA